MKISAINTPKIVKQLAVTAPLLLATPVIKAQNNTLNKDVFEKQNIEMIQADSTELSPCLKVGEKEIYPAIVVDISENQLYYYDRDGYLEDILPVATGKKSTPTDKGLRIISGIEDYPYSDAIGTKRRKNPIEYGPKVIRLDIVDEKSGNITGSNGEFIHGTNKPNSIGKYASKGCIRLDNDTVLALADKVKTGQYVYIKE